MTNSRDEAPPQVTPASLSADHTEASRPRARALAREAAHRAWRQQRASSAHVDPPRTRAGHCLQAPPAVRAGERAPAMHNKIQFTGAPRRQRRSARAGGSTSAGLRSVGACTTAVLGRPRLGGVLAPRLPVSSLPPCPPRRSALLGSLASPPRPPRPPLTWGAAAWCRAAALPRARCP